MEPPLVQHEDAAELLRHALAVGHDDEGRAAGAVHLEEKLRDLVTRRGIEIARRLVGQHEGRIQHQGPGDGDPLALTSGELPDGMLDPVAEAERGFPGKMNARRTPSEAWSKWVDY